MHGMQNSREALMGFSGPGNIRSLRGLNPIVFKRLMYGLKPVRFKAGLKSEVPQVMAAG
jgi:hypothetical protein